ncbi:uncharacterized protein LOC130290887 [Hyla sarda]|uniref:uncharacterized protein LOC130290887 n=1 Tax=Hyla sarda TaxID=327740 RepID=UPI0024C29714|nr:uncharacterized protein LOC130290887 [Hyla sarda]XP_056395062.1 uncharacterized protein LOC130290887 [Hyla sarda]
MFTNARSLANKMGELEALILEEHIDIVGVTETWLDSSHDWAVNLQGFTLFRKDRMNRKGGGVCLYVRSSMKVSVNDAIVCDDSEDVESLWVELQKEGNTEKIIFGVIYRPPNITEEIEGRLYKQIERAARAGTVVIMGDFNYPDIDWGRGLAKTTKGRKFLNLLQDNFMGQFVEDPTRCDALLDLIISNKAELVGNVTVRENLGNSAHNIVTFDLKCRKQRQTGKAKTYNFKKANFPGLRAALQDIDWGEVFSNADTEGKWDIFKSTLNNYTAKYIPKGNKYKRLKLNPTWLTNEVKRAINNKKIAFKKYKSDGSAITFKQYKELNKICKNVIKTAKIQNERQVAKESKTNPKYFF